MVIDRVICDAQEANNAAEEATALDAGKAQNKSSTNVKAGGVGEQGLPGCS